MQKDGLIKVCGMRERGNIEELLRQDIDLMGMIFYEKSPRCVLGAKEKYDMRAFPHDRVGLVGVFVNEAVERILELDKEYHFRYVQLHGGESVETAKRLKDAGKKIIKAVSVKGFEDIRGIDEEWESVADFMLFDYKCAGYGGSGEKFDWSVLKEYKLNVPFLLSGGIGEEDAEAVRLLEMEKMAGVDVNSKFETEPGVKDVEKVRRFISNIRA